MRFIILFLACAISFNSSFAQQRACGTDEIHRQRLSQDLAYKEKHEKLSAQFQRFLQEKKTTSRTNGCDNVISLPLAFHFVDVSADRYCLKQAVEEQVDRINKDFRAENEDLYKWTDEASSYFPDVMNGVACFDFCVATFDHPDGYGLYDGQMAITINQIELILDDFGDIYVPDEWLGYINVIVTNLDNDTEDGITLGFSPIAGGADTRAIYILQEAFGSIDCGDVNTNATAAGLGRTLTHEIGHYLTLFHPWGFIDDIFIGSCFDDDSVLDTPPTTAPYGGCPEIGVSECGATSLHMNYMDYVDDNCMYMFTVGQIDRMNYFVHNFLQNDLKTSSTICGYVDEITNCSPPIPTDTELYGWYGAKVYWESVPGAIYYEIQYSNGSDDWHSLYSRENSTVIYTFFSSQVEFRIRTLCVLGWSEFSDTYAISNSLQEQYPSNQVLRKSINIENIHPNPATDILNIFYNLNQSGLVEMVVYDVLGKKVISESLTQEEGNQEARLDINRLPPGTFTLQIKTTQETVTKKFIKSKSR